MAIRRLHEGTVIEFDDPAGLGRARDADGVVYGFHCTAIADGSRSIEVGTAVSFEVLAGHVGQFEAFSLVSAERASSGISPGGASPERPTPYLA